MAHEPLVVRHREHGAQEVEASAGNLGARPAVETLHATSLRGGGNHGGGLRGSRRWLALLLAAGTLIVLATGCVGEGVSAQKENGKLAASSSGEKKASLPANVASGKQLFDKQCATCHGAQGDRMPVAPLFAKGFLDTRGDATLITVVSEGKGAMPAWGKARGGPLTEDQVQDVIAYVNYAAGRESSSVQAAEGKELYAASCADCHGEKGERIPVAPLNVKGFLDSRTDSSLIKTIAEGKGQMSGDGKAKGGKLADDQVKAIVAYLRHTVEANVAASASRGRELYVSSCLGCHGERGERVSGVSLASLDFLASRGDGRLVSAISEGTEVMPGFGRAQGGSLEPSDMGAILAYLKAWSGTKASSALVGSTPTGEAKVLWTRNCVPCHGQTGDKVAGVHLLSSDFLQQKGDALLVQTVGRGNTKGMPAWGKASGGPLGEEQIAGLVEYLKSTAAGGASAAASPASSAPKSGEAASAPAASAPAAQPGSGDTAKGPRAGAAPPIGAAPAQLVAQGKEAFAKTCVGCHGETRDRIPTCKLADKGWVEEKGEAGLIASITNGKGGMPAWGKAKGGSLDDDTIKALAVYLLDAVGAGKSGATSPAASAPAAAAAPAPAPAAPASGLTGAALGKEIYSQTCQMCHGTNGLAQKNCPIGSSDYLQNMSPEGLRTRIVNGKPTAGMPSWGKAKGGSLSDDEITAVMLYLNEFAR